MHNKHTEVSGCGARLLEEVGAVPSVPRPPQDPSFPVHVTASLHHPSQGSRTRASLVMAEHGEFVLSLLLIGAQSYL